ncbi:MAG: response regulator [Bacteroidota bacterium]|nr:response regulator [Bacteroidota bacterium]
MNNAPILIVDDDMDDRQLLLAAWEELNLPHPLIFFENGEKVLHYLKSEKTKPFLILCDVNLPKMNGFELKKKLIEDPSINYKSIPFIFWSTSASQSQIQKSYDLAGHGFFIKEHSFEELKQSLIQIVNYWTKSKTPEIRF